jgi:hypothetical protein
MSLANPFAAILGYTGLILCLPGIMGCSSTPQDSQATHQKPPVSPVSWETTLPGLAKTALLDVVAKHDTLSMAWSGDLPELQNLPVNPTISLREVKQGFFVPTQVKTVTYMGITCQLVTAHNSNVYWTADSLIVSARIKEAFKPLNHVKIGMRKEEFFALFFTKYPPALDAIATIEFYTGIGDNSTCYTFIDDKLSEINYINIPDGN